MQRSEIMTEQERLEYCKNCKRSIYGEYKDCDLNIENNGVYVGAGETCRCKVENFEKIDVSELNREAEKRGVLSARKGHHTKKWGVFQKE
jgi:hypothetical protein